MKGGCLDNSGWSSGYDSDVRACTYPSSSVGGAEAWDVDGCTVDVTAGTEGVEDDCAWGTVCWTVDVDGCMVDGNACNGWV